VEQIGASAHLFVKNAPAQFVDPYGTREYPNPCPRGWTKYVDGREETPTQTVFVHPWFGPSYFQSVYYDWEVIAPTNGQDSVDCGLGVTINQSLSFVRYTEKFGHLGIQIGLGDKFALIGAGGSTTGKGIQLTVTASHTFEAIPGHRLRVFVYWETFEVFDWRDVGVMRLPGSPVLSPVMKVVKVYPKGYTAKWAMVACKRCCSSD
jgi:hypothetical protein